MIRYLWAKLVSWGWDFSYETIDPRERGRNSIKEAVLCVDSYDNNIDLHDPITFRVQAVSGGTVVETRWYDHKKDNNITKLHIVTSEENLAESIGKIVTMELLQK
jgi:hypothetical protein